MDLQLGDKIVLITGASKGIGYACAEAFAAEGSQVALVSRSRENLDARRVRKHNPSVAVVATRPPLDRHRLCEHLRLRIANLRLITRGCRPRSDAPPARPGCGGRRHDA